MQVPFKFKARSVAAELRQGTHFSAAILQQDVDVLLVLEVVIKVHDVLVVQRSVQLDFSVNLAEGENKISNELK